VGKLKNVRFKTNFASVIFEQKTTKISAFCNLCQKI